MKSTLGADIDAINRLREKVFQTGDIWDLIDHFTDDAVWMPDGGASLEGKDAVRAWATRFDGQSFKFRFIPEEVVVAGDWAFDRFVGIMTPMSAAGQEQEGASYFHYFWMLRRQEDDSWKIAYWIWNDHPPIE